MRNLNYSLWVLERGGFLEANCFDFGTIDIFRRHDYIGSLRWVHLVKQPSRRLTWRRGLIRLLLCRHSLLPHQLTPRLLLLLLLGLRLRVRNRHSAEVDLWTEKPVLLIRLVDIGLQNVVLLVFCKRLFEGVLTQ